MFTSRRSFLVTHNLEYLVSSLLKCLGHFWLTKLGCLHGWHAELRKPYVSSRRCFALWGTQTFSAWLWAFLHRLVEFCLNIIPAPICSCKLWMLKSLLTRTQVKLQALLDPRFERPLVIVLSFCIFLRFSYTFLYFKPLISTFHDYMQRLGI